MKHDYFSVSFLSKKYKISKSRLYYLALTDRLRFRYDNGLLVISEQSFLFYYYKGKKKAGRPTIHFK